MLRSISNYLHHMWIDDPDRWRPILAVYYLTYECGFRCPYCSDGEGTPYYRLGSKSLPAKRVSKLLRNVRRHCEHLVLTGGEPLEHPELRTILKRVGAMGFRTVAFTTNGFKLEPELDAVADTVTDLVFSLDTLDHDKADNLYGVGPGTLSRILDVIEIAASRPHRRYEILISCVITPDTLEDLYDVAEYAWQQGFGFAACPQLVGVKAHADLNGDPRYHRFYDFLIAEKRRGRAVYGAVPYLEGLRDLKRFKCHPFTMLVVGPEGDVFYPCLEKGHLAGNLIDRHDIHEIRREGRKRFGPQPKCGTQCHSACALGFSVALEQPSSMLEEVYLQLQGRAKLLRPKG